MSILDSAALRREYAYYFERRNTLSFLTKQHALNVVRSSGHIVINYRQTWRIR